MGATMETRPYADGDEAAVVALWEEAFPDAPAHNVPEVDIRTKLGVQRELFCVAEIDGRIVGTAMGGFDGHRGWVYYLAVNAGMRREGIGTALMQYVERLLAEMGCAKFNIMVRGSNREVVAFYEQLGFGQQDIVTLGKRLGPSRAPGEDPTR